jgi:hypothetical protein
MMIFGPKEQSKKKSWRDKRAWRKIEKTEIAESAVFVGGGKHDSNTERDFVGVYP